jgi:tetratricopeptide (TPR) repeat protein
LILVTTPQAASAQAGNTAAAALTRALDLEGANKCREAIPLYRQAIAVEDPTGAVLGLERCYGMIGRPDSILPLLDTLLLRKPGEPTLRTVQLRTLSTLRRDADLATAFAQWTSIGPREATPYRVYAQVLLDQGRARGADSVLQSAAEALGGTRELAAEFAQMQVALGMWIPAARSWRAAGEAQGYLEPAAVFSLMPVPAALRDSVRAIFSEPPHSLGSRRMLSGLELRWHAPRNAWKVLSELPPTDSTLEAWIAFGREAEASESWLTARDAYRLAFQHRPADRRLAMRAANAALSGGDPQSTLELLQPLASAPDSGAASTVLVLQVRALGLLGRPAEAESLLATGAGLDSEGRRIAQRALAWAWIQQGQLERADRALEIAGRDTEEGERVAAWISLFHGDLKTARRGLRRTDEASNDVVTAMALLSRTRADTSPEVGRAFLTLARGDTTQAAQEFRDVADRLPDAAPLLLATAGRLYVATRDTAQALLLWQLILEQHTEAPEAAESDLEWARVLRARGDSPGAIARLEHLILTYSQSALVPQARRELDLVRGSIPPSRGGLAAPRQIVTVDRSETGGPPPLYQ